MRNSLLFCHDMIRNDIEEVNFESCFWIILKNKGIVTWILC